MECTAASKPPEMPTPTCPKSKSRSGRRERTDKQQTLLTKRRRVSPTAIGLKPPFLLAKAVKGAPQNQGAKRESRVPASKLLIQQVRELRHSTEAGAVDPHTASKRCCLLEIELSVNITTKSA